MCLWVACTASQAPPSFPSHGDTSNLFALGGLVPIDISLCRDPGEVGVFWYSDIVVCWKLVVLKKMVMWKC